MRTHRNLLAVAAATTLALTACAPPGGGDEGAGGADSDAPIKIGVLADLTGATGDVGTPYAHGQEGYIDWVNSDGGIEGRQIDADVNDYAYDVPTAERLYKEYVNDGVVAVMGWGTGDSEALMNKVAADELPFMSASYAEVLTDPEEAPYNFVVAPTYSDQARIALNWIAEDGGSEVAILHHDSPFGTAPVQDAKDWVEEEGLDLNVQSYPMPSGGSNYVGLLSQVRNQGAEHVIIQNVSSPAAQVAKDIAAQGLDMKIVCLNWCSDELFIDTAGPQNAQGHTMVSPIAPVNADQPGHEDIENYLSEQGSSLEEEGLHYAQGWYTMHIMVEGMRQVLEDGDDLTGANIKEALETMGPIDTGGVIGDGDVEFSADSHRGSSSAGLYRVAEGQMEPIELGVTP